MGRIGISYYIGRRQADFPIDLLRLGIPSVFMVRNDSQGHPLPPDKIAALEFITEVKDYIKRHRVKLQLLARMKEIVVCICYCKDLNSYACMYIACQGLFVTWIGCISFDYVTNRDLCQWRVCGKYTEYT